MAPANPNLPPATPRIETLPESTRTKLEAVRAQLGQETGNTAFASLALEKLRTNVSRADLARQSGEIQSQNEFKSASEALRTRMIELQKEVTETPVPSVFGTSAAPTVAVSPEIATLAANVSPAVKRSIVKTSQTIPEWSQLPIIGGVLYTGLKGFTWLTKKLGNTGKAIAKPVDYAAHVVGEVGLWSGAWLMLAKAYEHISGKKSESE